MFVCEVCDREGGTLGICLECHARARNDALEKAAQAAENTEVRDSRIDTREEIAKAIRALKAEGESGE